MRDHGGHLVVAMMAKVREFRDAFHGEVLAIKESLQMIKEVKP